LLPDFLLKQGCQLRFVSNLAAVFSIGMMLTQTAAKEFRLMEDASLVTNETLLRRNIIMCRDLLQTTPAGQTRSLSDGRCKYRAAAELHHWTDRVIYIINGGKGDPINSSTMLAASWQLDELLFAMRKYSSIELEAEARPISVERFPEIGYVKLISDLSSANSALQALIPIEPITWDRDDSPVRDTVQEPAQQSPRQIDISTEGMDAFWEMDTTIFKGSKFARTCRFSRPTSSFLMTVVHGSSPRTRRGRIDFVTDWKLSIGGMFRHFG
jgi:hypothetical protein